MILKYLGFFFSVLAVYSLIKTQSIFSKKTGILFTLFVSKVSWLTLIITSYYGFKNFTLIWFLSGILIPVATIEISYKLLSNYIKKTNIDLISIEAHSYNKKSKETCYKINKIMKKNNFRLVFGRKESTKIFKKIFNKNNK